MQDLKYYQNMAVALLEENKERNKFYDSVDTAVAGGGPLPAAIRNLPWMVHFRSTSLHDAYAAARRTLVSSKLNVNVLPPSGDSNTAKSAERMERLLEYNFWLANQRGPKAPIVKIVSNALKYMAVAYQVVDVNEEYSGQKGPRIDAIKRAGRFSKRHHDVKNVHARWSDDILESVLVAQLNTGQELVDTYGKDHKAIKRMMRDLKSQKDMEGVDLMQTKFGHFILMDYVDKVIWIEGVDELVPGSDSPYEIMRKEHKLGFLPFVYNVGDDPLLKSAIETNQLENLNILLSMRYALIAATVAQARTWSKTPSGEGVFIDHSDPASQAQMRTGEEFGVLQPSQTDPHLSEVIGTLESGIANTTAVSRMLSSMDTIAANTPYSTINAMMQAALSSLVEIRILCEKSIADGMYQELHWVTKTGKPITGRRLKRTGLYDDMMNVGAYLSLGKDHFDANWNITVQLKPNSPTDRQERMTYAMNTSERWNLPRSWAMDEAGIEIDPEVALSQWGDEQMKIATITADVERVQLQPQFEMQQALMQPPPQEGPPPEGVENPAGLPEAQFNPGGTREAVTGRTVAGGETAGD